MSKNLDKMTKAELLSELRGSMLARRDLESRLSQAIADRDRYKRELQQLRWQGLPAPDTLAEKAKRYCQATGSTSVDRETLLHWQG
jgi:hypothetical protein